MVTLTLNMMFAPLSPLYNSILGNTLTYKEKQFLFTSIVLYKKLSIVGTGQDGIGRRQNSVVLHCIRLQLDWPECEPLALKYSISGNILTPCWQASCKAVMSLSIGLAYHVSGAYLSSAAAQLQRNAHHR